MCWGLGTRVELMFPGITLSGMRNKKGLRKKRWQWILKRWCQKICKVPQGRCLQSFKVSFMIAREISHIINQLKIILQLHLKISCFSVLPMKNLRFFYHNFNNYPNSVLEGLEICPPQFKALNFFYFINQNSSLELGLTKYKETKALNL